MSGKRSDPEDELFREAVRDVKPLADKARVPAAKRKPPAKARFTAADRALVLVESLQGSCRRTRSPTPATRSSFRRDGRAGSASCASSSAANIASKPSATCTACASTKPRTRCASSWPRRSAHNLRCVRIIHGKGKGSGPRGPVIKTAVNMILRKTAPVLAFTSARRVDGGTGAINVLLTQATAI